MTEARKKFNEIKDHADPIPYAGLEEFWSTLQPASIDFMFGEWRAGDTYEDTETMNRAASLWMEEFRGEVTATMVYDGRPIHDHFKKVDDDTIIAITNGNGALDHGRYMYFYLERA